MKSTLEKQAHEARKDDVPPLDRTVFGWNFPLMIPGWGKESSMKASKFSEAQIAFVLKQAEDGTAIGEVCRKAGISEATFYNWRKRYAGLMPSEVKRLRQLEEENAKLKRLVADLSLDKAMLQDVLQKKL
jgi:putative transposase